MAEESPAEPPTSQPPRRSPRPFLPGYVWRELDDPVIQKSFLRKVLLTSATQLLLPTSIICLFLYIEGVESFFQEYKVVYYLSYGVYLGTIIILVLIQKHRREFPRDFFAIAVHNMTLAYMLAAVAAFHDAVGVLVAVVIVFCLYLALILAVTFNMNFIFCNGFIFILVNVVVFFGAGILIVWLVGGNSFILQAVYGGVAALIFALYLSVDLQMLLNGTIIKLTADEFLTGALQVYIDMFYVFVVIVGAIGVILGK